MIYLNEIDGLPEYTRGKIVASMVPPGSKVLDIGCGPGQIGGYLIRKKNCEVTGVDWDGGALELAEKRGLKVTKIDLNTQRIYLPEIFDVIIATEVFEHVHDTEALVQQVHEQLMDGVLIASLPSITYWRTRLNILKGRCDHFILGDPTHGEEPFKHHFHVFDLKLMRHLLRNFVILEERGVGRIGSVFPTLTRQIVFKCMKK
jgi:methionine biosynthesis protein MetW